ncbi:hypothetical protein BSZ14_18370 [Sphingomonas sp. Sph1(2015)]|jgi:hypothetical protein|nr:hypothetical protein BSZ14_18370 [Sphingomonas sp. Sph1(2015)]
MRDAAMVIRVQHGIALGIGDALWWSLGAYPIPVPAPVCLLPLTGYGPCAATDRRRSVTHRAAVAGPDHVPV